MASVRDCSTTASVDFSTSTEAQTGTNISEISTNTASLNLRDSTSQMDGPKMMNTMAQAKPATDTAMSGIGPATDEASTFISPDGKDFSTQSSATTTWNDFGTSTNNMASVKTAGIMTSPTRKTNATSQFHSTTSSSSTMSAPPMMDGGTSPKMTGSSTRETQYESSSTISRSMNTRE